jgi:thiol-disulfide isomerase/thioredoxin
MKNKNIYYLIGVVLLAIILAIVLSFINNKESSTGPGEYDTLATCINDSGAKFYGAFWCSHCREQKKAFGPSAKLLPYVECSTPDANGQLPVCKELDIKGYPTWIFADGTRVNKSMSIQELTEKTSCTNIGTTTPEQIESK